MAQPLTERRVHSRFGHPAITGLRAVLRPRHVISVVNLSAGGALFDGARPLRPGSRVFFQIPVGAHTAGRLAHVLRSAVVSIDARDGPSYRSAIRFDERWDSIWEQCTLDGYLMPGSARQPVVGNGHALPDVDVTELVVRHNELD